MGDSSSRRCRGATLVLASVVLLIPAVAIAQRPAPEPVKTSSGIGYAFAGIGAVEGMSTFNLGGGGEAVLADAFGVGAELGYLAGTSGASEGIGTFSVNGTYHAFPRQPARKVRPFVTAGYTLGFRFQEGHANMWNFGGGVNFWLKPRTGLRVEFRDHVYSGGGEGTHFWGARAGVIFR